MTTTEKSRNTYEVEILTERIVLEKLFGKDFSRSQYPILLHFICETVSGDITPMEKQMDRIGVNPLERISIGLLSVEDTKSLLDLIDFTQTENGIFIGSIRTGNGVSVYIEDDVDEELIQDVGGKILQPSSDGTTVFQMTTDEVLEFNQRRGVYRKQDSLAAEVSQTEPPEIDREEIRNRISDRVNNLNDRLDHIPDSYQMPEPDNMTIGSAKEFSLGIVFVDIAGFSDYAATNDDEDVLFMLNLLIPELMEAVRESDGDFEKNTGDGILVYFGAGEDNDWTSHLLLTYIATIKTILADFVNPVLKEQGIEPVSIKVGAAMGDVFVSRIGVNRLNRRTVVGETANIASRLEEKADGHEYFVSQEIKEAANKADSMWAEHIHPGGTLSEFEREGEEIKYYDFRGVLEPTNRGNFVT
jgi:adenylate cyclase